MFTSKNNTCSNNPEKSYTEKKAKHLIKLTHLINLKLKENIIEEKTV